MKRKKARHKLIAIEFLSNISLDGCYNKQLPAFDHRSSVTHLDHYHNESAQTHSLASDLGLATALSNVIDKTKTADFNVTSVPVSVTISATCHVHDTAQSNGETLPQSVVNDNQVTQPKDSCETCLPNSFCTACSARPLFASEWTRPVFSLDTGAEPCAPPSNHKRERDLLLAPGFSRIPVESPAKTFRRITLCPIGLQETRLEVFSIIPYVRKNSSITTRNAVRIPRLTSTGAKGSTDAETLPTTFQLGHTKPPAQQVQPQQQQLQQQSTSNSSGARDHLLTTFAVDPVWSLSSLRPSGDEVVSFARFLKPHLNLWLSNPGAWTRPKPVGFASFLHRDSDTNPPGPVDWSQITPGREVPFNDSLRSNPLAAQLVIPSTNRNQTRNLSTASLGTATTSSWSRTGGKFTRARHPSGGSNLPAGCAPSAGGNLPPWTAAAIGVSYPDPLLYYVPSLLDDPDLLVSTGKRVLKLPNYLTSVITYVRPSEQKRNVNREFHERFPLIQLTLTKLRSIKSVLVRIVHNLSLDLWIAAHSHVLFEKLILRLFINKANRKLCASAVLLISAKLNDVKGPELSALFQELENNFRISRRDLIHTELDVALSLEFCLVPNELEIVPHYFRIHKGLDLTPPFPIPCLGHLPHSASLPSVTE